MPPFEDLPFLFQAMLVLFSIVTLTFGSLAFWRMLKSIFGRSKPTDE